MNNSNDPRRPEKIVRFTNPLSVQSQNGSAQPGEDLTPDYMNVLGMIFSMCALMMRLKWCAWIALYCSCISFANTKLTDDTKQIMSSFMLSISAVVMSYLQNPAPMTLPGMG
ncbi:protein Asterix-like isoform X2 [Tigriopus californicus]|uniref:protein Asterix-like isoform X2 n=1 Tax=Tigriopus californicus TaxID=6832 RepID=UPI0027DA356C|nr:protein Asterix-like isoform X2 [Tigriopus californicus]